MIKLSKNACLAGKAPKEILGFACLGPEDLERDFASQVNIFG